MAPVHAQTFPYDANLLAACRGAPELFPFLLESAAHGTVQGRYDLLFARPDTTMLVLHADGSLTGPHTESAQGDFLTALDAWWRAEGGTGASHGEHAAPFRGGWFLFLGYELAGQVEASLQLPKTRGLPMAFAARVPAAVIRDHATRSAMWS